MADRALRAPATASPGVAGSTVSGGRGIGVGVGGTHFVLPKNQSQQIRKHAQICSVFAMCDISLVIISKAWTGHCTIITSINPSNAKATFVQSTKMQKKTNNLKTI